MERQYEKKADHKRVLRLMQLMKRKRLSEESAMPVLHTKQRKPRDVRRTI